AGVLHGVSHPFREARTIHLSEPLTVSGECVVFSNELFDAQPCVRIVFRGGHWVEMGVEWRGDALVEVELDRPPANAPATSATEGYRFDQPLAAAALAEQIAAQSWSGLFVAFDYGKTLH